MCAVSTCGSPGFSPITDVLTILQWFDLSCFNHRQTSTLSKMEPRQVFGPPQRRFDASLFKTFPINERLKMEFRAEVFNLFNSPNFNTPAGTSIAYNTVPNGQPNAGAIIGNSPNITGASTPSGEITAMSGNWNQREIQFALRFLVGATNHHPAVQHGGERKLPAVFIWKRRPPQTKPLCKNPPE
jgi:hypothetical protein